MWEVGMSAQGEKRRERKRGVMEMFTTSYDETSMMMNKRAFGRNGIGWME